MPNKKISELPAASAFTGAEKFELVQSGLNVQGTAEQITNYVGGYTRESDRAYTSEILFDKNEIEAVLHTQDDEITFTVADGGHLTSQWSSYGQRITTDGVSPINFVGFSHISNISSGEVLEAGTYQFIFWYSNGIARATVMLPSEEQATLTPLSTPANFDSVVGAGDPETEIDMTWDAVANVSSYEIYYSVAGSSGPWILVTSPAAGATSYTHTGLDPGTTYHHRIRAIGDGVTFANSGYAIDATTTEDAADPGAPTFAFSPADAATDIAVNDPATITASIPIRDQDGSTVIVDANLSDYITVKEDNGAGADIPVTMTIDATKTIITITPNVVWPPEGNVFIQIAGVEGSTNSVHAATDDATFTASSFTRMAVNTLNYGDILDSVIAANDADFNLKFTAKELLITGGVAVMLFRKYEPGQRAFLFTQTNNDISFKWYGGVDPSVPIREIVWSNILVDDNEHEYDLAYRGAIDTNNGLDRLTFKIDGVTQGSKSIGEATLSWPFNIQNTTAPLKSGPSSGLIKDVIITSANDTVTELNIPIVRTGLDVSGNARHGTWA